VNASGPGEERGQQRLESCDVGTTKVIDIATPRQRGAADGTEIPFSVVLTDNDGRPVASDQKRLIVFDPRGVGTLHDRDSWVPEHQCAADNSIYSFESGVATITASVGNRLTAKKKFSFILPLSISLILFALVGGIAGAFVRATRTWSSSRRWGRARWLTYLASGALTGLCIFLAYYYGMLTFSPKLGGNEGLGFLLGIIGGYLGNAAIDRIVGQVFPFTK
jgi:hypothetical protein